MSKKIKKRFFSSLFGGKEKESTSLEKRPEDKPDPIKEMLARKLENIDDDIELIDSNYNGEGTRIVILGASVSCLVFGVAYALLISISSFSIFIFCLGIFIFSIFLSMRKMDKGRDKLKAELEAKKYVLIEGDESERLEHF